MFLTPIEDATLGHVPQVTEKHSLSDLRDTLAQFVLIGPSNNRHKMVPFHLPSITLSAASIGHGEISFFETPVALLPLTTLSALLFASVPIQRRLKLWSQ